MKFKAKSIHMTALKEDLLTEFCVRCAYSKAQARCYVPQLCWAFAELQDSPE